MKKKNYNESEIKGVINKIVSENKINTWFNVQKTIKQAKDEWEVAQEKFFECLSEKQIELFFDMQEKEVVYTYLSKKSKKKE